MVASDIAFILFSPLIIDSEASLPQHFIIWNIEVFFQSSNSCFSAARISVKVILKKQKKKKEEEGEEYVYFLKIINIQKSIFTGGTISLIITVEIWHSKLGFLI